MLRKQVVARFFADYVRPVSKRDIVEMGRIGENVEFQTVLMLFPTLHTSVPDSWTKRRSKYGRNGDGSADESDV
jgi:hypothetical protein